MPRETWPVLHCTASTFARSLLSSTPGKLYHRLLRKRLVAFVRVPWSRDAGRYCAGCGYRDNLSGREDVSGAEAPHGEAMVADLLRLAGSLLQCGS